MEKSGLDEWLDMTYPAVAGHFRRRTRPRSLMSLTWQGPEPAAMRNRRPATGGAAAHGVRNTRMRGSQAAPIIALRRLRCKSRSVRARLTPRWCGLEALSAL